jgi:hypothetical protein
LIVILAVDSAELGEWSAIADLLAEKTKERK